ncbi:MAG: outer membrane protein assembly factor, partial [Oligoflexia bacterium]|nr:outer membrane protein assembly factor [Oligoflexia bacterium]
MIRKTLPVLIGTLLSSTLAFADVSLEIKGLDRALEDNVDAYLSAVPEEEYAVSLRFQSRLESMIKEALNALGYYQPTITFSHSEDETELTVTVEQGEPVRIYESDIVLSGEAKDDPDFLALIAKSKLSKGMILNHGNYDSLKSSIRNLGLAKGYFDGT